MKWGAIIAALILAALPAVASADILAWTDNAGVTHYTNLKGEVPSQQAVQVVVDEQVWVSHGSSVPVATEEPVAQLEPPVDTGTDVLRAYLAGLESGLARDVSTGTSVYISGPLAVTISAPTPYSSYLLPGYGWLPPGYYPYLTPSVIGWHQGPLRGRFGPPGFHRHFPFPPPFSGAVGPPPFGAAGPPPFGAAGPPPSGAGRLSRGVSGGRFAR